MLRKFKGFYVPQKDRRSKAREKGTLLELQDDNFCHRSNCIKYDIHCTQCLFHPDQIDHFKEWHKGGMKYDRD